MDSDASTTDGIINIATDSSGSLSSSTPWEDGVTINAGSANAVLTNAVLSNLDHLDLTANIATLGDTSVGDGAVMARDGLDVNLVGDLTLAGDISMETALTTQVPLHLMASGAALYFLLVDHLIHPPLQYLPMFR